MWSFLRPIWLHIPGCPALGEWSHHHGYLGHEDLFCIIFLCILAIFCFCYVHTISVLYRAHLAWNVPLVSLIFLKRSLVFPILLLSSISLHWSLRKAFLSLLATLWNSTFRCLYLSFSPLFFSSLLFTATCKASSDSHFAVLHFFLGECSWFLSPVQCHEPPSIVHPALYQI